ncbi:unnamed protein product [Closterium sp. NIES-53]
MAVRLVPTPTIHPRMRAWHPPPSTCFSTTALLFLPISPHSSPFLPIPPHGSEARRNTHCPASDESMNDMLLYNQAPVFAGKNGHGYFEQSYVFRKAVGSGDAVTTE